MVATVSTEEDDVALASSDLSVACARHGVKRTYLPSVGSSSPATSYQ